CPTAAQGNGQAEKPIVVRDDHELFQRGQELQLDVLHTHCPVSVLPAGHVPTVRSLHGHSPYCPSGSRFLKRLGQPCDRAYSLGGCLLGHLADRCGSVRPLSMYAGFARTWQEMRVLPQLLVITDSRFLKEQMVRSGYPEDRIFPLRLPPPEVGEITPPP